MFIQFKLIFSPLWTASLINVCALKKKLMNSFCVAIIITIFKEPYTFSKDFGLYGCQFRVAYESKGLTDYCEFMFSEILLIRCVLSLLECSKIAIHIAFKKFECSLPHNFWTKKLILRFLNCLALPLNIQPQQTQ